MSHSTEQKDIIVFLFLKYLNSFNFPLRSLPLFRSVKQSTMILENKDISIIKQFTAYVTDKRYVEK